MLPSRSQSFIGTSIGVDSNAARILSRGGALAISMASSAAWIARFRSLWLPLFMYLLYREITTLFKLAVSNG
jgi:hypothetical protein